jgi:hypothetical protein
MMTLFFLLHLRDFSTFLIMSSSLVMLELKRIQAASIMESPSPLASHKEQNVTGALP